MSKTLDDALLAEIEADATEMARGAGAILSGYFDTPLVVEYKDVKKSDPVTVVDVECQEYVTKAISQRYPDHGIVGEEDAEQGDSIAPDFVWVLDPLDGTKNFLNGLPVFACSIGVLHRGAPIVGALFIPWPGETGGVVMRARKGGGAFEEGKRLAVFGEAELEGNMLVALPGSFGEAYRVTNDLRDKTGDIRVTGSIAYELAMTARGALQYSITTAPRLWDVAAGVTLISEAGGHMMMGRRTGGLRSYATGKTRWVPLKSFVPSWQSGETTLNELRKWSAPLVAGSPGITRYVTKNLKGRPLFRHRLARAARRLSRCRRPSKGTR